MRKMKQQNDEEKKRFVLVFISFAGSNDFSLFQFINIKPFGDLVEFVEYIFEIVIEQM